MLISKKEKKELVDMLADANRKILQEELLALVMRKMTVEYGADGDGKPIIPPVVKEEEVNVIDECAKYLMRTEGALRGVQEQTCLSTNTVGDLGGKVQALGDFLLSMDSSLRTIGGLSDAIKSLPQVNTTIQVIEDKNARDAG